MSASFLELWLCSVSLMSKHPFALCCLRIRHVRHLIDDKKVLSDPGNFPQMFHLKSPVHGEIFHVNKLKSLENKCSMLKGGCRVLLVDTGAFQIRS